MRRPAYILGVFATPLTSGPASGSALALCLAALKGALADACLTPSDLSGLVTAPALAGPPALAAHRLAQAAGLGSSSASSTFQARSLDACGAAGVACLLEARGLVRAGDAGAVAVVLGDAVASPSLTTPAFLARADAAVGGAECPPAHPPLPSPSIVAGYDSLAAWAVREGLLSRGDLAAYASLAALHGSRHPGGLAGRDARDKARAASTSGGQGGHPPHPPPPLSADAVLSARPVGSATTLFECARRADGAAAVVVGGEAAAAARGPGAPPPILLSGGGRGSGPLTPAHPLSAAAWAPLEAAVRAAYGEARLSPASIDLFYPYDCYPITALAALAALGATTGGGGRSRKGGGAAAAAAAAALPGVAAGLAAAGRAASAAAAALVSPGGGPGAASPATAWPVNTHGGLLGGGAPWASPALFSVVEAALQLSGRAGPARQVPGARVAVVHANGGILSEQAVAVLERGGEKAAGVT